MRDCYSSWLTPSAISVTCNTYREDRDVKRICTYIQPCRLGSHYEHQRCLAHSALQARKPLIVPGPWRPLHNIKILPGWTPAGSLVSHMTLQASLATSCRHSKCTLNWCRCPLPIRSPWRWGMGHAFTLLQVRNTTHPTSRVWSVAHWQRTDRSTPSRTTERTPLGLLQLGSV